ncbi:MAG: RtcB family protein [Spirochaetaceae bacterium]|jgi:RNA-splicing ligase RtcB|nr:RtcB family protein [Spirochaetaceae bacterium]
MIKPIKVTGKCNEALVYAKAIEANCKDKIRQYLGHPAFADTAVRIMPDVHLGKGTVAGFTAACNSLIIPSVIGVDIGCGVCACNLGRGNLRFDKLDVFIRKNIPSGTAVRGSIHERLADMVSFTGESGGGGDTGRFKRSIRELCDKQGYSPERVFAALGTLGGGNHFIEIDRDENHNRWLLIHSGSRIPGKRTAEYHEIIALRETEAESPLKYLSGSFADDYRSDMAVVQRYARINRALMATVIRSGV